jgi:hypothetical protein
MAKKNKFLPKRVGGVKVPKRIRKSGMGQFLASPAGQALIAQAVVAAGAVAGAKKVKDSPKAREALADIGHDLKHAGADVGGEANSATATLAYALGEAARSFTDALHHNGERHDGPAWAPSNPAAPPAGKKKPEVHQPQPL